MNIMPVRTDKDLIEKFLERGVEDVFPSKDALREKLMSGKRLRAYQGYDPTGPYLHIGHAMGIRALRILQQLGHEVIMLMGDFTAKVGDPDKPNMRELLSDETIEKNLAGWKEQAANLIDFEGENPVLFKRNSEWLSKLTLKDLIYLMNKSTVQQMIERDLFQRRLKANNPIGLQEFIYPLMQGYDSVKMDVDIEIGGNDQIFNMLMGRHLVKEYLGKEKFVRANQLMEAPNAITMSKTKGNGINLSDSSEDIFGKGMSYPDELVIKGLRLLTDVPMKDIWQMEQEIGSGANPMQFKKIMAFEITKMIKGEKEAKRAQKHFEDTVQNKEIKEENMEIVATAGNMAVLGFLKEAVKGQSSSNIKRIIEQGGVEINGNKITEPFYEFDFTSGTVVKFGKRRYFKVK